MKVIENELTVEFDVDDTLLMWHQENTLIDKIIIEDPYSREKIRLTPHVDHVKLLMDYKFRGYHVTVWSAAGWQWAKAAVVALKLQAYVDVVRTKPLKFVDDLPAGEVLGQRVYIPFKSGF